MLKKIIFTIIGLSILLYFYNFNVTDDFDSVDFEYNVVDDGFMSHLQQGWSSIQKTEFGKGVLPIKNETILNVSVPKVDTYLFRIMFYSKYDIKLIQINAFINNFELRKIGVGLKKDKKYMEFFLPADKLSVGDNNLKIIIDNDLVNKLVFISFKFQNFIGYNSNFPKFKVLSDTSTYFASVACRSGHPTKLGRANLLLFISIIFFAGVLGFIRSRLSKNGFIQSVQRSIYSFVLVLIIFLAIILVSSVTEYHVLFSVETFVLFTLFVAIITEFVLLYQNKCAKDKYINLALNIKKFMKRNADILIYFFVGAYFIIMSILTMLKHFTFHSNACDMALFDQMVMNIIDGKGAYINFLNRNYFNEHFSIIFYLIAPFYYIYNSPITLLVIQTLFFALGSLAIYLLAKHVIKDKLIALVFSFIYLISPQLIEANFFDFHQESFVPFFIIFAFYSGIKKHYIRYFVFLLLAFFIREDIALYGIIIGLYFLIIEKDIRIAIPSILIGVLWFVITIGYLITPDVLHGQYGVIQCRYTYLGRSIPEILKTVFLQPLVPLKHIFEKSLFPTIHIFFKMGFLPLFNLPTLLLTILPFSATMLSDYGHQYKLDAEYAIPALTFLFIASIYGFARMKNEKTKKIVLILFIIINFAGFMRFIDKKIDNKWFEYNSHTITIKNALSIIPVEVSVSGQSSFVPHLSRHKQNYLFPNTDADYILIDKKGNKWPLSDDDYFNEVEKLQNNKDFNIIYEKDSIMLFKRSSS